MLYEQHHPEDLLTPSIGDGVHQLNSSLTSLDFFLLDDINTYLCPIQSIKAIKNDLLNDSLNDNSQHQDELFFDIDLVNFHDFEEQSDFLAHSTSIEGIDIEEWISQACFPSPPMDTTNSSISNVEETPVSTDIWMGSEHTNTKDMIVPPSPSLSSTDSPSISSTDSPSSSSTDSSSTKKPKLSPIERKLRKKGQNKTAAEKYRMKKKSELHQLLDRHSILKDTNKELKLELENLTYRVEQFKKLFTDLMQVDL